MAVVDSDATTPGIPCESCCPVGCHRDGARKHFYGPDIPPVTLTCQGAGCRADICPAAFTSGHLDDFQSLFGLARIHGGIHYRNTIEVSWMQGEAIAQNVIRKFYVHAGNDN